MSIRKRLSPEESRQAALDAARSLLIEDGPQALTLKAVASRIGRTHANLLHHFGSAAGLQKALAKHLAVTICASVEEAVIASRTGVGSPRAVVDLAFDAFGREGGGALASWMLLTGNEDALDPIVETVHDLVINLGEMGSSAMRDVTHALCLMAMGDAQLGGPLSASLELPRASARETATQMLAAAAEREGLIHALSQPADQDGIQ